MAFYVKILPKYSCNISSVRLVKYFIDTQKYVRFSYSTKSSNENSAPVKFSTNEAAKVPIAKIIGIKTEKSDKLWYQKYVIVATLIVFAVYFVYIRKENDIDEYLKGNPSYMDPKLQLIKLKTQLIYCEKNNLPVEKLKAKIEELEDRVRPTRSPFRV